MGERPPQKHRGFADPREHGTTLNSSSSSRLHPPSPPISLSSSSANAPANGGNVDRVLFKNLVEMVPLVESLMDRRANSSFTRRASMVYTPTPSNPQKAFDHKGRKAALTVSAKKRRDTGENVLNKHVDNGDGAANDFSIFTSMPLTAENVQKEREELTALREQMDELHKKLWEKDEALKSAEESMNQMRAVYAMVDELRRQVAEKDSLIKSLNSQLSNAKIKLADKQAALEKLVWEARTSSRKVDELQGDLNSMNFEVTALMYVFEELSKCDITAYHDENIDYFHHFDHLPHIDGIDEAEMETMEEARLAYVAAVAAAKEKPSEDSIAAAAEARQRLQAFVF